jgi:hypothetical protein
MCRLMQFKELNNKLKKLYNFNNWSQNATKVIKPLEEQLPIVFLILL